MTNFENTIRIKDFGAATAMIVRGFRLTTIERINSHQCEFIFNNENHPSLSKNLDLYWTGELMVSAQDFHQKSKILKNRLHAVKDL